MREELFVKNARLRGRDALHGIHIREGKFYRVAPAAVLAAPEDARVIDAGGRLVIPPLCDPHQHLDATLSVGNPRYNMSGTLLEGIQIWGERKQTLTKEIIKENAVKAIKWEVANGVLRMRTHADATDRSLLTVEALAEVREEMKDLVDLQIVAFPQDCVFTFEGGTDLMESAMRMGCDVVGGLPYIEFSREDGVADVKFAFDLAEKYGALVDIHCDENTDDQSRFVEVVAREAIVRGMEGRATASHTTAMHNYNNDYAFKLMGVLQRASLNIITNPYPNSVLQNRTDGYPRRRGCTRVDELLAAGVNVCIGHDDLMDPWYPMGKGSMLGAANLLMHTAQLSGYDQIGQLLDMITVNSARTMCLEDYGIEEGNSADFVVLDADTPFDAVRLTCECLYVVRRGKIVCETEPARRELRFGGRTETIDFKL